MATDFRKLVLELGDSYAAMAARRKHPGCNAIALVDNCSLQFCDHDHRIGDSKRDWRGLFRCKARVVEQIDPERIMIDGDMPFLLDAASLATNNERLLESLRGDPTCLPTSTVAFYAIYRTR